MCFADEDPAEGLLPFPEVPLLDEPGFPVFAASVALREKLSLTASLLFDLGVLSLPSRPRSLSFSLLNMFLILVFLPVVAVCCVV